MAARDARSGRRARAALAAAVVLHLVVLYAPTAPGTDDGPVPVDKLVHVAVFALVAWTARRAGLPLVGVVAALLGHAVVSELVQDRLLPERAGDAGDVVADAVGVALGVALGAVRPVPPWRSARRRRGTMDP